jgi:hypothetical protein
VDRRRQTCPADPEPVAMAIVNAVLIIAIGAMYFVG